jgi:glycosyltransferase involved in cell wall biosynthesis
VEEVIDWYRRSDILLLPSLSEGLPVVGVQAMAMGLALVLSRVGGSPELVETLNRVRSAKGQNGYLLAPDDLPGFISALRELLSDRARLLAMRQASRASSARFDLHAVVAAYEQVFTQAARRPNR